MYHLHGELTINLEFRILKTAGAANFKIIVAGTGTLAIAIYIYI